MEIEEYSTDDVIEVLKLTSLFSIFAVSLFFGYLPLFCKVKSLCSQIMIDNLITFSCGLLMGTGMFLLLPHCNEILTRYSKEILHSQSIPISFIFTFFSYACILLFEKVIIGVENAIPFEIIPTHEKFISVTPSSIINDEDLQFEEEALKNIFSTKGRFAAYMYIRNQKISTLKGIYDRSFEHSSVILSRSALAGVNVNTSQDSGLSESIIKKRTITEHFHEDKPKVRTSNNVSSILHFYLMAMSLCLIEILEGFGLILQSNLDNTILVMLTIIFNEISFFLSFGLLLKQAKIAIMSFIRYIFLLAFFCPLGGLIGYFLPSNEFLNGVFLALSSGAFLYSSSSMVIIEEFSGRKHRYQKFLFYFLGLTIPASSIITFTCLYNK